MNVGFPIGEVDATRSNVSELRDGSAQFDPDMVEAFSTVLATPDRRREVAVA